MIEVEAKVEISNPKKFRDAVQKIARYKGTKKKIDDYYAQRVGGYPERSLRIRQLNGHYEVNVKRRISFIRGVHAKEEVELLSKGKDVEVFKEIIKDLGFKRWLRKDKTSEVYEISPEFAIEINKVKDLGWFIEVEYLAERNGIAKARVEVLRVMKKLGFSGKDFIKKGYTKILWEKGLKGF